MIRGRYRCPGCGNLGHRESSSKCPLNGTKKRKRKPRKNSTKGWFPKEVSTPNRDNNTTEVILQESPDVVTRRRLAMLAGEDSSSQPMMPTSTPTKQPTSKKKAGKKLTPKRKKA